MNRAGIRENRSLAFPALALLVVVLAALRLLVAANSGLARDEGYYTLWSLYPSAGYLDHPPLVAYSIWLGRALLGDTALGVRFLSVISLVVASGLLYRLGTLLFDRRVASLAVLWYNLTLVAGLSIIVTPDAPSTLFWVASLWAVAEFMRGGNRNWLLLAGLLVGLGVLGKYTDVFLGLGLVLFATASPSRRRWLAFWQVWAGALLGLAVLVPNMLWNLSHGGGALWFQGQRTLGAFSAGGFLANLAELLAGQALFMGPILVGFAGLALALAWTRRQTPLGHSLALPVLTSLPLLLYFLAHAVHSRVEANWLAPIWPGLTLAAVAASLEVRPRSPAGQGTVRTLRIVQPLLGGALMALFLVQAWAAPFEHRALDRTQELRGWGALHARLAEMAAAEEVRLVLTEGDYGLLGELVAVGLFKGSDLRIAPIGERLRYAFMPPVQAADIAGGALYIMAAQGPRAPPGPSGLFGHVRFIDWAERRDEGASLQRFAVFAVSAPKPAFSERANALQ